MWRILIYIVLSYFIIGALQGETFELGCNGIIDFIKNGMTCDFDKSPITSKYYSNTHVNPLYYTVYWRKSIILTSLVCLSFYMSKQYNDWLITFILCHIVIYHFYSYYDFHYNYEVTKMIMSHDNREPSNKFPFSV